LRPGRECAMPEVQLGARRAWLAGAQATRRARVGGRPRRAGRELRAVRGPSERGAAWLLCLRSPARRCASSGRRRCSFSHNLIHRFPDKPCPPPRRPKPPPPKRCRASSCGSPRTPAARASTPSAATSPSAADCSSTTTTPSGAGASNTRPTSGPMCGTRRVSSLASATSR
jgi:hypothetical protein